MDLPQPPSDQELKNIIDKLAQFVARNGPEFEHMTKQKQKYNPKFSFLFGGSYFHYYQYRVTTEQAILKQKERSLEQQAIVQQALNRQSIQTAPWQQHIHQLQDTSQEQIRQSEQNLAAQHQLLLQQQQVQVDEVIRKAQDEKLNKLASDNEIDLKELDSILQPIIDSCTKDSISTGKGWIFSHATTYHKCEVIILYILKRVTEPGATFEAKLHLVYLINDVLHHCIRKNAEDLKKILETAVVPIFCSTSIGVEADKQQKLSKLHKLWETNKYFSQTILDQLQNPAASLAAYQAGLIAEYATLITPITASIQTQYSILQKQHQDFVAHLTGQMQQMQVPNPYAFQSSTMMMPAQQAVAAPYIQPAVMPYESQVMPQVPPAQEIIPQPSQLPEEASKSANEVAPANSSDVPEAEKPDAKKEPLPEPEILPLEERTPDLRDIDNHRPDSMNCFPEPEEPPVGLGMDYIPPDMHEPPYGMPPDIPVRHSNGRPPIGGSHYPDDFSPQYGLPHPRYGPEPEYGLTPPHSSHYGRHMPYRDIPPIGPHDMPPDYMEPALPPCQPPYYDLPAGLMVPLIRLEDTDYNNPLDPDDVRLPPPALPTERLLAAVEQFYCPPTHERTRNNAYVISSEGWEQLGLYEFFKAKTQAKKQKGLPMDERDYNCSMDLPAMKGYSEQPQKTPRRRYREVKSPEPESAPAPPPPPPPVKNGGKGKRRSRSISRSRSRSPDGPPRRSSRSPSPQRIHFQRSRGRSRSRSPEDKRRSSPDSRDRRGSPDSRDRRGSPDSRDRRGSPDSRDRRGSPDRDRSPSPPSFNMGSSSNSHERDRRLDESNKGHQLLKKMGWSGAGLGATEQGIQDPVDAGDVRDRQDMYKGIGSNLNDPYENFRKSKGQAFINRMKARAEELGKM